MLCSAPLSLCIPPIILLFPLLLLLVPLAAAVLDTTIVRRAGAAVPIFTAAEHRQRHMRRYLCTWILCALGEARQDDR